MKRGLVRGVNYGKENYQLNDGRVNRFVREFDSAGFDEASRPNFYAVTF